MFDERRTSFFSSISYSLRAYALILLLTAALGLLGCDSNEVTENPEIDELIISPDSVSLAVGEQVDFSVVALTSSGDTVRDVSFDWVSTDSAVFTVEDGGTATGQNPGSAFCTVEVRDDAASTTGKLKAAKRRFVGRDSAFVSVFGN